MKAGGIFVGVMHEFSFEFALGIPVLEGVAQLA
jgi:hypothetical protein